MTHPDPATKGPSARGWRRAMSMIVFSGLLAGCGAAPADGATAAASDSTHAAGQQAAAAHAPASAEEGFRGSVSGDRTMTLDGSTAISGAIYGRYQFSFAGQPGEGSDPVIISLARDDADPPGPGTYSLGEDGDFDGNIEIHPGPEDYAIQDGELVINSARGDALAGRLRFTARERAGTATLAVDASFQTRPAN